MDALIFDFDGVVVDSEPVHLATFQQVLRENGLDLRRQEYYSKYLGFDDHDCFQAVGVHEGRPFSQDQIARMTARKTLLVQQAFSRSIQPMPGAVELIRAAAQAHLPVGVCSGALREEILLASRTVGALDCFSAIVSAQEAPAGKPDPSGYRLTLQLLAQTTGRPLRPARTVVIEDAPAGIAAARSAGMRVLAVTNSYPPAQLAQAHRVVASLAQVTLADLTAL